MSNKEDPPLRIMAVGDLMMGCAYFHSLVNDSIPDRLETSHASLIDDDVIERLNEADLLFGNLECVISDDFHDEEGEIPPKLMAPVNSLSVLENAGFDVLNLANNHILDHGPTYVEETMEYLDSTGIAYIGNPLEEEKGMHFEKNGQEIWLLGYYLPDLTDDEARKRIISTVEAGDKNDRLTIVSLHWGLGIEHMHYPSPNQVSFARSLVDHGTDIILGHHSHTFQPIEKYGEGLIAYSLGNFIFDMWRKENRASGILEIRVGKDMNIESEVIPTEQIDYKVEFATDDFMREILNNSVGEKSIEEYRETASRVRRKHRIEVIQQYLANCHKFPLKYHLSTWKRWTNKVINERST